MDQDPKHDDHDQAPLNENGAQSRRAVLKKMALGGGVATGVAALPSKWAKPIANRVLVPAHAQTSGDDEFEGGAGGPNPKMGIHGSEPGQIFIIGKVAGGIAYLQFVTQYPYSYSSSSKYMQSRAYSGSAWSATSESTTTIAPTTLAPTTTRPPKPPGIPPGYHYEYRADIPVATKRKTMGNVEFVPPKGGPNCPDPGTDHGYAYVEKYVPGKLLEVKVWGDVYTLDPVNPAALPGLTGCDEI